MVGLEMTRSRHLVRLLGERRRPDMLRFARFLLADEKSLIPRSFVSADRT